MSFMHKISDSKLLLFFSKLNIVNCKRKKIYVGFYNFEYMKMIIFLKITVLCGNLNNLLLFWPYLNYTKDNIFFTWDHQLIQKDIRQKILMNSLRYDFFFNILKIVEKKKSNMAAFRPQNYVKINKNVLFTFCICIFFTRGIVCRFLSVCHCSTTLLLIHIPK